MGVTATEVAHIQVLVTLPPRTKKNHGQLMTTRGGGKRPRLFPAKAWTEWCQKAEVRVNGRLIQAVRTTSSHEAPTMFLLSTDTAAAGFRGTTTRRWQPLERPMNCAATFYRDRTTGDAVGYYQGLADLLEKRGIIRNDSQIVSWDGSRLAKDAENPRTEIVLTEAL